MAAEIKTGSPANTPVPVNQHLVYTIGVVSGSAPDRYVVQVYESNDTATDGSVIAKLYLTPNTSGLAYFDLSDVAGDRVSASSTEDGNAANIHVSTVIEKGLEPCVRKYTVKVGSYTGGTETLAEDSDYVYLLGGVEQIASGLHPDFSDYYPQASSDKAWLTDRAVSASTISLNAAVDDEGIMCLLHTDNLDAATSLDTINFTLFNGSTTLDTFDVSIGGSTTVQNNLKYVPCLPANIEGQWPTITNFPTSWTHYLVYGYDTATATGLKTAYLKVNNDCRPIKHDPVQLAWTNTRGGWDYLRFDGRNLKTIQTEGKDYRKSVGFDFNAWDRQTTPYHKTGTEAYQLRNQLFTAAERDLLQYAFRSLNVMFRVDDGDWLPCTIVTNSYQIIPAASKTFDVSFQIELAQEIRC